jgi:MSHA biogenesis protein MshK
MTMYRRSSALGTRRSATQFFSRACASRITHHASWLLAPLLFVASLAHADALVDPTRPPMSVHKPGVVREVAMAAQVTAIFNSDERRVAVLNGQVVKVGDRVGDITVQEINADGVRYLRAGRVEFARLPRQAAAVRRDAAGAEEGP